MGPMIHPPLALARLIAMFRFALIALVALSLFPLIARANELANPGFEEIAAGKLIGWRPYGLGWVLDREVVHVGRLVKSMTEFSRDAQTLAAVRAEIADQLDAAVPPK
jgi:hypothetical protein